jgi:hypothetical protein
MKLSKKSKRHPERSEGSCRKLITFDHNHCINKILRCAQNDFSDSFYVLRLRFIADTINAGGGAYQQPVAGDGGRGHAHVVVR